jgi:hypothetical protein
MTLTITTIADDQLLTLVTNLTTLRDEAAREARNAYHPDVRTLLVDTKTRYANALDKANTERDRRGL